MPFTYPQVTISGTDYNSYVTVADADAYLNASINAAAWNAVGGYLSDDDKGRAIITAVRIIDAQNWKGEKTEADNALAWPRTCLDGDPPGSLPQALELVTIRLAFVVSQNADLAGESVQSAIGQTKRLRSGSLDIEYSHFGISASQAIASIIRDILGPLSGCLAGAGSSLTAGAFSSGTSRESPFSDPDYGFVRGV